MNGAGKMAGAVGPSGPNSLLCDQVVLISGGTAGLGAGIARAVAREGATVAVTGVAAAITAFGRVDSLVNAAGLTDRGTLLDTTPELFDAHIAVNLKAPFFLKARAWVTSATSACTNSALAPPAVSSAASASPGSRRRPVRPSLRRRPGRGGRRRPRYGPYGPVHDARSRSAATRIPRRVRRDLP